jgi:hypothetical protein
MRTLTTVLLLHAVCWLCYYNSLQCSFTFDDHLAIVGNRDTLPVLQLGTGTPKGKSAGDSSDSESSNRGSGSLWRNDIWGKDLLAADSHRSYRPLLILLFRVLRSVHDSPQCIRAVSVELHALVCCALLLLGELLWEAAAAVGNGKLAGDKGKENDPACKLLLESEQQQEQQGQGQGEVCQ